MNNSRTIPIPEMYTRRQLNALYRSIPLKDNIFRLLRKYTNATANLYGILPVRMLYDIIQQHEPGKITKVELLRFIEVARHEREQGMAHGICAILVHEIERVDSVALALGHAAAVLGEDRRIDEDVV